MSSYPRLTQLVVLVKNGSAAKAWAAVFDNLTGIWIVEYIRSSPSNDARRTISQS
jgi:hypothetical protein